MCGRARLSSDVSAIQLLFSIRPTMNAEGVRRDTECRPTGLPIMAFLQAFLVRSSPDQRLLGHHLLLTRLATLSIRTENAPPF
jgi:hypothetical protein